MLGHCAPIYAVRVDMRLANVSVAFAMAVGRSAKGDTNVAACAEAETHPVVLVHGVLGV